jgi:hypothetical protein
MAAAFGLLFGRDSRVEKQMKHTVALIVLLMAAAASYIAGSATGTVALVGVGLLLELGFWFVLIKKRRGRSRLV